ncbi:rhodanese-like domain [Desulfoluna butyratoxydans]|uniref:Rhodanese-like domain n=2 Tax=Desulfoluna butyratoxydans TaxID=231438 RepID=A0A4U8YPV3_9BACT|nr:rhodanese-like domain [Desulfoluna butyratoxydans]
MDIPRVTPWEMQGKLARKAAWLVCAYEAEERFRQMHLDGAISLERFQRRLPMMPRATEVVFYCN